MDYSYINFSDMQKLPTLTYEDMIRNYCTQHITNMDFLIISLSLFVLIFLCTKLIYGKIRKPDSFLKIFVFYINLVSEMICFMLAVIVFAYESLNLKANVLYRVFITVLESSILLAIASRLYIWLSVPKNRDRIIAIFKRRRDTPLDGNSEIIKEFSEEKKQNGKKAESREK
jgi:hypothetical protein